MSQEHMPYGENRHIRTTEDFDPHYSGPFVAFIGDGEVVAFHRASPLLRNNRLRLTSLHPAYREILVNAQGWLVQEGAKHPFRVNCAAYTTGPVLAEVPLPRAPEHNPLDELERDPGARPVLKLPKPINPEKMAEAVLTQKQFDKLSTVPVATASLDGETIAHGNIYVTASDMAAISGIDHAALDDAVMQAHTVTRTDKAAKQAEEIAKAAAEEPETISAETIFGRVSTTDRIRDPLCVRIVGAYDDEAPFYGREILCTRDGQPVQILWSRCRKPGSEVVYLYGHNDEGVSRCSFKGRVSGDEEHPLDLMRAEEVVGHSIRMACKGGEARHLVNTDEEAEDARSEGFTVVEFTPSSWLLP